ncbi:unnamed protein product, partial [Onchocerca ochengi]|uniref:Uncharacterized protein n=1 Tax=Onchocerca ochengi TaxID=42157 RepID=A0A182EYY4_ONCOC
MENSDYKDKDVLELSLREPIGSTLSSSLSLSDDNEYYQLPTTNYTTTKHIFDQNTHFYGASEEEIKKDQSDDKLITHVINPDQMLQEIKKDLSISNLASTNTMR